MMTKIPIWRLAAILFASFSMALIGCSGGSSSSSSVPTPSLNVLPASFNFGIVTEGNIATPLEVSIQNTGTANLNVSSITLDGADMAYFTLDLDGGTNPCGAPAPALSPGESCSAVVGFNPLNFLQYNSDLVVQSNDPTVPEFRLRLRGTYQQQSEIKVKISQLDACPRPRATVYISVTDEGGFSVTGLESNDFSLAEKITDTSPGVPVSSLADFDFVANKSSLSVAIVMDYSRSIVSIDGAVSNMENAAKAFVQQMNGDDEAEIIKYSGTVEVTQEFTSDLSLLIAAIEYDPQFPGGTALYDAVEYATDRIKERNKDRKAIIVLTDGQENSSLASLEEIIDQAKTNFIPVYTVGFGDADPIVLQELADETGGSYSESEASDNLIGIYTRLADLLFKNQYILSYDSTLSDDSTGILEVTADHGGISGSDTIAIPACN